MVPVFSPRHIPFCSCHAFVGFFFLLFVDRSSAFSLFYRMWAFSLFGRLVSFFVCVFVLFSFSSACFMWCYFCVVSAALALPYFVRFFLFGAMPWPSSPHVRSARSFRSLFGVQRPSGSFIRFALVLYFPFPWSPVCSRPTVTRFPIRLSSAIFPLFDASVPSSVQLLLVCLPPPHLSFHLNFSEPFSHGLRFDTSVFMRVLWFDSSHQRLYSTG